MIFDVAFCFATRPVQGRYYTTNVKTSSTFDFYAISEQFVKLSGFTHPSGEFLFEPFGPLTVVSIQILGGGRLIRAELGGGAVKM